MSAASRHWRLLLAAMVVAGAGVAAWALFPRDSSAPGPVEPEAYRYATNGSESVDILGGATHVYPPTTGITIRAEGCGRRLAWRPLRDRSTEYELCGGQLRSIREVHEFFGQRDVRTYRCAPGSSLRHGWRCSFGDVTEVARGGPVGTARTAGGAVVHVRLRTEISGGVVGTGTRDFWLRRADGLPVRLAGTNENSTSSPVGTVGYSERYELRLEEEPGG